MVQKVLILFLLFILPVIVFPFGISMFETPKILLAEIAIEALFILSYLSSDLEKSFRKLKRPVLIAVGIILGLSLFHLLVFSSPLTLFGNIFRLQGVFLLWHLVFFSLISSNQKITINKYIPITTLCVLIIETYIFGQNINGRYISALGEPNAFAATLVFLLPFLLKNNGKWTQILYFVLVLVVVILTGSRSGIVALGIESLFLVSIFKLKISVARAAIFALILLFLSYLLPFVQYSDSYENRAQIWLTAANSAVKSPVVGQGFGDVESALKEASRKSETTIQYAYVDSTHNIFLDWLVEGGIVGLTALVFLIGFALLTFIKHKNNFYLASFLGLLVCLSFNPGSIVSLVAFWWLLGQGFDG